MKKLWLALACIALTACGNTPKNEVAKTIPSPQEAESQAEFERRCFVSDSDGPRGQLNSDRSLCRKVVKAVNFAGTRDNDYIQTKNSEEHELRNGAGPGALVFGSFDGNAMPPEITLNGETIARGNLNTSLLIERAGDIHLVTFAGNYKSINYSLAVCFSRGTASASCRGF